MGYHVDKILGFGRVPPVVGRPLDYSLLAHLLETMLQRGTVGRYDTPEKIHKIWSSSMQPNPDTGKVNGVLVAGLETLIDGGNLASRKRYPGSARDESERSVFDFLTAQRDRAPSSNSHNKPTLQVRDDFGDCVVSTDRQACWEG